LPLENKIHIFAPPCNILYIFTKSKEIGQKLTGEITHIKELCKHMDIKITVSDLTGKKLFSFTDSTVVEA